MTPLVHPSSSNAHPSTLDDDSRVGALGERVHAAVVLLAVVEGDDPLGAATGVVVVGERDVGVARGGLLADHLVVAVT